MEKCVNAVLRILLIVSCIVLAVTGTYLFCAETVNAYYRSAKGDTFTSSMSLNGIFPMNNGSIIVCGSYLPGDSVYLEQSLFFKSYDAKGAVEEVSGLSFDDGYSLSDVRSDGNVLLVTSRNSRGDVKLYSLSPDLSVTSSASATFDSEEVTGIYTGLVHSEPFIAKVRSGNIVTVKSLGEVILSHEFSEDLYIDGVYFAGNTFYLKGKIPVGEKKYPFISGFSMTQVEKFEISVSLDFSEFTVDDIRFLADGKTYIIGKQFNREAYASVAGSSGQEPEEDDPLINSIANRAVTAKREFGSVLISSDYEADPWCSRFLCSIDPVTGELGTVQDPVDDGPAKGITEIYFSDAYILKKDSSTDNPESKPVIATMVTKNASAYDSENYLVNVYLLFDDMSLSKSADIYVPSDHLFYPGSAPDGSLFCYTGITAENGSDVYSMKRYSGTEEAARVQRMLPVLKQIPAVISSKISARIIFYAVIFLILYATARYRGTENIIRARKTALLRQY
ncbi:MAG: hypothetical protein K6G89_04840 [Clostridia bacterium]|nr:hypothetical protein [Clostridia bacterium]